MKNALEDKLYKHIHYRVKKQPDIDMIDPLPIDINSNPNSDLYLPEIIHVLQSAWYIHGSYNTGMWAEKIGNSKDFI